MRGDVGPEVLLALCAVGTDQASRRWAERGRMLADYGPPLHWYDCRVGMNLCLQNLSEIST